MIRKRRPVFVVYKERKRWRWWLEAGNGRVIALSKMSYVSRRAAKRATDRLARAMKVEVRPTQF